MGATFSKFSTWCPHPFPSIVCPSLSFFALVVSLSFPVTNIPSPWAASSSYQINVKKKKQGNSNMMKWCWRRSEPVQRGAVDVGGGDSEWSHNITSCCKMSPFNMKVNLMDGPLFTKTQREKQSPPPPLSSLPCLCHTYSTHPLVAASLVDRSDHLQVKGRIQMAILPFLHRCLHPEQRNEDRQKINQSDTWKLSCFITLLSLTLMSEPQVGKETERKWTWEFLIRHDVRGNTEVKDKDENITLTYWWSGYCVNRQCPIYTPSRQWATSAKYLWLFDC